MPRALLASLLSFALLAPSGPDPLSAAERPTRVRIHQDRARELTVLRAEVRLSTGRWRVVRTEGPLEHVVASAADGGLGALPGDRSRRILIRRRERQSVAAMLAIRARIYDLEQREPRPVEQSEEEVRATLDALYRKSPWPDEIRAVEGPYFFRIPGVPIPESWTRERVPLLVELRPFVEDGRHHVLNANGTVARVKPDAGLLERHRLKIAPVVWVEELERGAGELQLVRVEGLVPVGVDARSLVARVSLRRVGADDETTVLVEGRSAAAGGPEILRSWASMRSVEWRLLAQKAPSSALAAWLSRHDDLYDPAENVPDPSPGRDRGRSTTVFNVLGGRAAIRETLQMQALEVASDAEAAATIAVESVPGVEVKSHPFDELLGDRAGGEIPLANHVPVDRFFVYFAKPSALAGFLDRGSKFLFRTSQAVTGSSLEYRLVDRYLERCGMSTEWVKALLESGAVEELALVLPDLFLIDGTDVTAILRIPGLDRMRPLLGLLGVRGLDADSVVERTLPGGHRTYWAARGDLLHVSTHRGELAAQPEHDPGDREFGWLRRLDDLELSLQLEEGGLRTRAPQEGLDRPDAIRSGPRGGHGPWPSLCSWRRRHRDLLPCGSSPGRSLDLTAPWNLAPCRVP